MAKLPSIGGYSLIRLIGHGATGEVYLALHLALNRQVALKVLRVDPADSKSSLDRFKREAQAAMSLSHPRLVKLFDYGEDDGYHFLVMEYVEGRNLLAVLEDVGPLADAQALRYLRHLLEGLSALHQANMLHRDIKPGNLI